ncbi:ATP-dependent RNA helicase RhlB [Desulfurispira natronophila]|uniref:ATP-dependent RNA helicase RhlB n=1 Tax=Desulfurispira natronophila TaxID=682562 RepID=UPI00160D2359
MPRYPRKHPRPPCHSKANETDSRQQKKATPKPAAKDNATAKSVSSPQASEPGKENTHEPQANPEQSRKKKTKAANWSLEDFIVPPEKDKTRFHDMDLPLEVMQAVHDLGFQYCTPIQAKILPRTLEGKDAIGKAQTGTGKSAAFLITIITRLLADPRQKPPVGTPRALILAPTRELAMQIAKDAHELCRYTPLNVVTLYGGMDMNKQRQRLESEPVDIVVATPGRLLDLKYQKYVFLAKVELLVIDEADRMLDMGFIPDVRQIVQATMPKNRRQTLIFSATLAPEVTRLASTWMTEAVEIEIEPDQVAVDSVDQQVFLATGDQKFTLLWNLIEQQQLERVIVFANRRDETRRLAESLERYRISCAILSGDIPQNKRIRTLEDFREGRIRVLVATDVAGRGIHVDGISHVINYTLPENPEDYVHRIGRTGRAGASGISVSFACEDGSFYIPAIEDFLGKKLSCIYPDEKLLQPLPKPLPLSAVKSGKSGDGSGAKRPGSRQSPRRRRRTPKR